MAITLQTDSAGNLLVNPVTSGNNQAVIGPQATGAALTTNPVYLGVNADGGNGAAAAGAYATADNANNLRVNTEGRLATYSSGFSVTPAASATDVATIIGSSTKIVKIKNVTISGIATTAANFLVQGIKRSAADTSGTSTAPAIVNHDSNDGAATAVVANYSANPTLGATGSKYGTMRQENLFLGASTNPGGKLSWDFGTRNEKSLVLRGVADAFCINLNGVTITGGTLYVEITWTEE